MSNLQIHPSVRSVFDRDGAVVMHIQQGLMYTSNPVGGLMLELLSQGLSPEQVVERVCHECDLADGQEMVRADLEKYIGLLESYGIVEKKAEETLQI
jgi:Coenzyme PQQ synthesis protein D (PqqD)